MNPEIHKPARRLRWVVLGAAVLGVLGVLIYALWPKRTALEPLDAARRRLVDAVQAASAVRLEQYQGTGAILAARPLAREEFARVAEGVPPAKLEDPNLYKCFIPHHRIVVTDAANAQETAFLVCFTCDQVNFGNGILNAPAAWRKSLRELFSGFGIAVPESER